MKVAIIQELIDTSRGGAETSTLEMARRLAELGPVVTVVCADCGAMNREATVEFVRCGTAGGSRAARTKSFVAAADLYCREGSFDIVHAVVPCYSCNVYQPRGGTYLETVERSIARAESGFGRLIKRLGRRLNRRQRFLLRIEREMLSGEEPPFVAGVSEYVCRQVAAAFPGFPRERNRVVFNGVDTHRSGEREEIRGAARRQLGIGDETNVLLFVAHNFKLKGLEELIRAVAGFSDRDWLMLIAGRDQPRQYQQLVLRLGIQDRIRFLGSVEDTRELFGASDLLVHPTWYDPCSRVVLEALDCGLPVVTTRYNGAAEVIEDGRHGFVVDSPRDILALRSAILRGLEPRVRQACEVASGQMREQLSMARHARELKALYEDVLAAGVGLR